MTSEIGTAEFGLKWVKPTTFSIDPDPHCCSFNRLKYVRVEGEYGTVLLTEKEIGELVEFCKENC